MTDRDDSGGRKELILRFLFLRNKGVHFAILMQVQKKTYSSSSSEMGVL